MIEIRSYKTRELPMQAVAYGGTMTEAGNIAEFLLATSFTADCISGQITMNLGNNTVIEFGPNDVIIRAGKEVSVMNSLSFNEKYEAL